MKKKEYERPTMQVFKLKQQSTLLAGSGASGGVDSPSSYEPADDQDPLNP